VASGCSLPTDTPFSNIHAMMDAVREIGYPPNEDLFNYMIYKGHFPSQYDSYCSDYI